MVTLKLAKHSSDLEGAGTATLQTRLACACRRLHLLRTLLFGWVYVRENGERAKQPWKRLKLAMPSSNVEAGPGPGLTLSACLCVTGRRTSCVLRRGPRQLTVPADQCSVSRRLWFPQVEVGTGIES